MQTEPIQSSLVIDRKCNHLLNVSNFSCRPSRLAQTPMSLPHADISRAVFLSGANYAPALPSESAQKLLIWSGCQDPPAESNIKMNQQQREHWVMRILLKSRHQM
ncbi:hypothetical protein OH492_18630 [Vibrio chagasii]|nr:hypothetical protein [Vibrio chagasii]